ncbi:MAG: MCE family protein [Actinomycetia bacterium]|nr:MCE family protein [Actinomycetes bacterium]
MTTGRLLAGGIAVVVVAIVVGLLLVIRPGTDDTNNLTVDFDRTVSLYEGADVRILGVQVGQVESVDPMGDKVRVELSWDAEYKVPADAKAVIVSPSIVGDRYIQLTPAYESGPVMGDDTVLDASDTGVPVELDEVYKSLDQLAKALGPEGANKNGSLDRLLSSSADAFDGQGKKFHRMLNDLSKLTRTLDDNKDELFGSMTQLERFVKALADNATAVRRFNSSLADVSSMLSGERQDLSGALRALGSSLDEIRTYVRDNRGALKKNVKALVDVTDQLVDQRKNLAKIMNTAPTALANQVMAYNPTIGALDNRSTVYDPGQVPSRFAFHGFDFGLVSPRNHFSSLSEQGWAGGLSSWCLLAETGGIYGTSSRACTREFTAPFAKTMMTRGLEGPSPTAGPDRLASLRRTSQSSNSLASLMAVR